MHVRSIAVWDPSVEMLAINTARLINVVLKIRNFGTKNSSVEKKKDWLGITRREGNEGVQGHLGTLSRSFESLGSLRDNG